MKRSGYVIIGTILLVSSSLLFFIMTNLITGLIFMILGVAGLLFIVLPLAMMPSKKEVATTKPKIVNYSSVKRYVNGELVEDTAQSNISEAFGKMQELFSFPTMHSHMGEVECEYCGAFNSTRKRKCSSCGAPISKK